MVVGIKTAETLQHISFAKVLPMLFNYLVVSDLEYYASKAV